MAVEVMEVLSPERAVIAALLLDARVMRFVGMECTAADFEDLRLGVIFDGITTMLSRREPVDVITVSEKLAEWDVRGISAADLHGWITSLPSAQAADAYAASVHRAAMRRGLRDVAVGMANPSGDGSNPGAVIAWAMERLKELQRQSGLQVESRVKTLAEVLEGDDSYDWVIEGLLERGDRLMLTGTEGGGKSTLVRQFAIMAAAGLHPFSFKPMSPARVLVVDAENSELQWRRAVRSVTTKAATWGARNPAEHLRVKFADRMDLTRDADLSTLHELLDDLLPDILFIGPLYRLVGRAINSDDDAAPLLAALDTLRARGLAMVIEAHAGHAQGSGGERDLRPRGSSALLGWPEFGLGLAPAKDGKPNEFRLIRWRGDRDARHWPSRIARGISEWPWTPTVMF